MESIADDSWLMEKIFLPLMDDNIPTWMSPRGWEKFDEIIAEFDNNRGWRMRGYVDDVVEGYRHFDIIHIFHNLHNSKVPIYFTPEGSQYYDHLVTQTKIMVKNEAERHEKFIKKRKDEVFPRQQLILYG